MYFSCRSACASSLSTRLVLHTGSRYPCSCVKSYHSDPPSLGRLHTSKQRLWVTDNSRPDSTTTLSLLIWRWGSLLKSNAIMVPLSPWGTILKRHRETARSTTSSRCHVKFSLKEPVHQLPHARLSKQPCPFLKPIIITCYLSLRNIVSVLQSGLFPTCIGPYYTSAAQNSAS